MRIWIDAQTGTWGDADDDFFIVDVEDIDANHPNIARRLRKRVADYIEGDDLELSDAVIRQLDDCGTDEIAEFGRDFGSAADTLQYCGRVQ